MQILLLKTLVAIFNLLVHYSNAAFALFVELLVALLTAIQASYLYDVTLMTAGCLCETVKLKCSMFNQISSNSVCFVNGFVLSNYKLLQFFFRHVSFENVLSSVIEH